MSEINRNFATQSFCKLGVMYNLNSILQTLGINTTNGLYDAKNANWKADLQLSSRVKRCLEQINPKAFFCIDNKPLILFFENPTDKDLHKKIWNINEVPVIITINKDSVEIFNGFNLLANNTLEALAGNDKLTDFSYFQLVTGKTWEIYEKELNYKNRVDYKLLDNISAAREQILKQFPPIDENDKETKKQYVKITNALLGKIIFVRYLIDREVELNFEDQAKIWKNDDLCKLLTNPTKVVKFFEYLADKEKGFNGDLFPLVQSEYKIIPQEAYNILIRLLKSQEIATGQQSLFDLYDFSIIPTEFISNVYEYFIGADNQSKQGAYYTPLFLVDYILSKTIENHIAENQSYRCKILDPACGSGVFLVETLRKLIEQYRLNSANDLEQYKEDIKNIAVTNIFGIDKDESAVQVAVFSIYLTLLDYMQPREIKSFKFPNLIGTNFFDKDFFDEKADFNKILKNNDFSFIIGNPPWFRGKNEKKKTKQDPLYVQYINNRKKRENCEISIDIGNKEIAQAFLLRSSDFSSTNTKCALISTSKVLYNLYSRDFRQYFLHNYAIERVFELAPVRREVFDKSNGKAITPACVLFFSYAHDKNTDTNPIEHIALKPSRFFSMFKIFSIYRHDIQTVQQDRLKKHDWLWKVLVYGSYLDFNFINRLKENYKPIEYYINNKIEFIVKQGIKKKDGEKKIDVSELIGWKFIDTDIKSKKLQPYFIVPDLEKWNEKEVGYVYRSKAGKLIKDIFIPPALLIKDGLTPDFKTVAAMLNIKGVFTDNVTSVKALKSNSEELLTNILLLLCSELNSYWALQTASFVGIKQERSHDDEKFSFPFLQIPNSEDLYKRINILKAKLDGLKNNILSSCDAAKIEQEIESLISEIDQFIHNALNLSPIEQELLNYAKNIIIPSIKYKFDVITAIADVNILADYANLFIERFASNFEKIDKKFIVEIWHTKQIIGMFFKVISKTEYNTPIEWKDKQQDTNGILQKIIDLGITKITDQLFIQKDIRGFEKDYFYIFKPNEKRLWHKAVGYLDVEEFADAILKAGRDKNE
jgi:hypothetical protein